MVIAFLLGVAVQVGWDMKVGEYRETGFVTEQVPTATNVEIKPGG